MGVWVAGNVVVSAMHFPSPTLASATYDAALQARCSLP